jgi:hypothetical protein
MIIVKKVKVKPELKEMYRGKKFVQMKDPRTNRPLTENDTISLKEMEQKNIMIFETRPHANFQQYKKEMFIKTKYYYEEVI